MKKLTLIFLVSFLSACNLFESDKYFSCRETLPDIDNQFSIVVTGNSAQVNRVTYQKCKIDNTSLTISDDCKNLSSGYMGVIDLITGEFHSTFKKTEDSKVSNYTKAICKKVEKM